MNKFNIVIVASIFLYLTLSCSIMKGKETAEPAVERFHQQFNASQFSEIYTESDGEFKKAATEKQLTDLLEAVHRKLGTVQKATQTGWFVNTTPFGTAATMTYDVEFTEGKAVERFIFNINGDKALLVNYNIDSPLLIIK